jgi:hypothetical protein
MRKLVAILNVVAWAGFWAFGFLALSGQDYSAGQLTVAALLAAAGFLTGIWTWVRLAREGA